MVLKYTLLCIFHLSFTIFSLNILILPFDVTCYHLRVANLLICAIIAKKTFRYSKKLLLGEKLKSYGKAVLITGSARGIGNALAKHLDSKGYHVFASCLNSNSPGADDLRKSCSSRLRILQLDVNKAESVEKAMEFVKDNLGACKLWAIVNNAGIQKGFLLELSSIQDFKDTFETNVIGSLRVTKAFLPLLRKSKGRVINITSLGGRIAAPFTGPYTISKFASVGFSECLRHEMDMWGIRVISIEPEFFETDLTASRNVMLSVDDAHASVDEEVRKDYGEEFLRKFKTGLGRILPPSPNMYKVLDAVECAVCLKTPDATYRVFRNIVFEILYNIYESCPIEFQVFLAKIYFRSLGISKPEKAN